jgi:hypothetical protein
MDDTGCLAMSVKELNRLEILSRVLERRLTQTQAADQLGLGVRQVERLCRKLRIEGPQVARNALGVPYVTGFRRRAEPFVSSADR